MSYWFEGWLITPPRIGGRVSVLRMVRNGVEAVGLFLSTEVVEVTGAGFTTLNSHYRFEPPENPRPLTDEVEQMLRSFESDLAAN